MQVYRGTAELLDYVFYATTERGRVYETGSFIHNYALTYALGLAQGDTYTYAWVSQSPHYIEELTPLNGRLYITPGQSVHASHRLIQWNTLREGYAFPSKPPSLGYPDWGFARMLRPGSCFLFYVFVPDLAELPATPALRGLVTGNSVRVRLGKFLGKVRLRLEVATSLEKRSGGFQSDALLNWRDLETDPVACDILAASLPTRLLSRAYFAEGDYYHLSFGDDTVRMPVGMRYLARLPEKASRRKR